MGIKSKLEGNKAGRFLLWLYAFAIKQWFFVVLAIFIGIAKAAPNFARHGGLIRGEYSIGYGAVAFIFLQSGLSMKSTDLLKYLGHWRAHGVILIMSFLVTSGSMYGICSGILKANDPHIDNWVLVGLVVTATCPTTVASNVVMTTQANGNALLCLCAVFIGNIIGSFVSPLLLQMYTSTSLWEFGNPANGSSLNALYRDVMKQLGLSALLPLFVGQVIQNIWPKQTKWTLTTFKLNKVGSFCLLLIMFSSFSTAFYQDAFTSIPKASAIFLVFFNIGMYFFWTVICYFLSRPFFIPIIFRHEPTAESTRLYKYSYTIFRPFYFNRRDTICIMFCGAAKTAALGVSLISAQYGDDFEYLGRILASLVLFQALQVVCAQVLVHFFKKWEKKDHLDEVTDEEEAVVRDDDKDVSFSNNDNTNGENISDEK
jgi:sodium/bile acid cotransporter 7